MPDPLSGAAGAAAISAAKTAAKRNPPGILSRVLGPPADSIGKGIAQYIDFRFANGMRIVENAAAKVGDKLNEEGQVPPRVAGRILDEGSWCDDSLMVEYLGGALASARTPDGRDDRAARWAALVTRLSAYEIRAHYIIYRAMRDALLGAMNEFVEDDVRNYQVFTNKCQVLMPLVEFVVAMEFDGTEDVQALLAHAIEGLRREGLVEAAGYGPGKQFAAEPRFAGESFDEQGYLFAQASPYGAELFLFAHGEGGRLAFELVSPEWSSELHEAVVPPTPRAHRFGS
jgi:hypothetical protein